MHRGVMDFEGLGLGCVICGGAFVFFSSPKFVFPGILTVLFLDCSSRGCVVTHLVFLVVLVPADRFFRTSRASSPSRNPSPFLAF